jgi:hypothetical protein
MTCKCGGEIVGGRCEWCGYFIHEHSSINKTYKSRIYSNDEHVACIRRIYGNDAADIFQNEIDLYSKAKAKGESGEYINECLGKFKKLKVKQ